MRLCFSIFFIDCAFMLLEHAHFKEIVHDETHLEAFKFSISRLEQYLQAADSVSMPNIGFGSRALCHM